MSEIQVIPVSAFKDNYIWTLRHARHAVLVDPGEAQPAIDYLDKERLTPAAILVTHHHRDHVGGIPELLNRWSMPVYGPRSEAVAGLTHPVGEDDRVEVPALGLSLRVLDIPGHTLGHVAYYGHGMLFCGDTLFACGCGRLFEGTAQQMYESLQKLASLPDDTLVYCGHEYTLANQAFAKAVEPANPALDDWNRSAAALRERGRPTLPSTIGREKAANPFLRCAQPAIIESGSRYLGARLTDPMQVFAAIRQWKNAG